MLKIKRTIAQVKNLLGFSCVNVQTVMTAKKKVWNPATLAYEYTGDKRVVKNKCVTDAFVALLIDSLQAQATPLANLALFKYHDCGTGTSDEAAENTSLGTPFGGARVEGNQIEGSSGNIYKSVATITFSEELSITEHGLFNASTSGTLMDRTKFTAINVLATNQIEFTFEITFTSGG
ncbi:hypothetical protein [Dehalococcoides sp. THU4]|uniref:hypothetical protein n=1 Tax=Dehalococcoides sp. THU4 TaxID=3348344 RepID=UPI003718FED2